MKEIIAIVFIIGLLLSLSACTPEGPADLTGKWLSEDTTQYAEIKDDIIVIYWYDNEEETKSLFWAGNYIPPTEPGSFSWVSVNNRDKTDWAILASMADDKEFSYNNGIISYEASLLGTTKTMKLKRLEK